MRKEKFSGVKTVQDEKDDALFLGTVITLKIMSDSDDRSLFWRKVLVCVSFPPIPSGQLQAGRRRLEKSHIEMKF